MTGKERLILVAGMVLGLGVALAAPWVTGAALQTDSVAAQARRPRKRWPNSRSTRGRL